ncbi:g420 [Coccomyxa viridis]|uniref:G420 protein n=1 Tax=Coccomyxa viridis TaxID=1274662 RepID=A0ABP1FFN9_9CHLO
MAAYRDFMRKGRKEGIIRRSWEDNPNDKLFDRGIHKFSQAIQNYYKWSEKNPNLAKGYRLSQFVDASPNAFGLPRDPDPVK